MVKIIETHEEWKALLAEHADKLVVVDFYADWCGPCKVIGPHFVAHSEDPKFEGKVVFVKVDVDNNEETSQACEITAMPTFQFYKGGNKVDELKGCNKEGLENLINKHA